jgi:flagellar protein FlgJ
MSISTPVYNDFSGLANLERGARERSPEATREAARQFEAVFVKMMLKSMRDANAVLAEDRDRSYEQMFDDQIALDLTRGRGIGLAEMLVRQMTPGGDASTEAGLDQSQLKERIARRAMASPTADEAPAPAASPLPGRQDFRPDSPEGFLRKIWPLAEAAGERLGVDPQAIAAQATLETGWGKRLIRDGEGLSGNNLFGIKADRRWDGEKVNVPTLEYRGGIAKRESAQFRAYQDLAAGFEDYVSFLKTNPRYAEATAGGLSAEDYAHSLQRAGYATDPDYANKIRGVMTSPRFEKTVSELKNSGGMPTSL